MEEMWLEKIKFILRNIPDLAPKISVQDITLNTRFKEDMGFDSLAMASFFYELQDQYDYLEESEVPRWKNISDCIVSLQRGS